MSAFVLITCMPLLAAAAEVSAVHYARGSGLQCVECSCRDTCVGLQLEDVEQST